jgi:hypothetical protein
MSIVYRKMNGIAVVSIFAILAAFAAVGTALYIAWDTRKQLRACSGKASDSAGNVHKLLQEFAKDVDRKFAYYMHDPYQLVNLTESGMQVRGGPQVARLGLGATSAFTFDPVAQTLAMSPTPMGARVVLSNDTVDLTAGGNSVKIGSNILRGTSAGLQLCNAAGTSCKTL